MHNYLETYVILYGSRTSNNRFFTAPRMFCFCCNFLLLFAESLARGQLVLSDTLHYLTFRPARRPCIYILSHFYLFFFGRHFHNFDSFLLRLVCNLLLKVVISPVSKCSIFRFRKIFQFNQSTVIPLCHIHDIPADFVIEGISEASFFILKF